MTSGITPTHIAIVLVITLLLFGAKRLPETGRALGRGMREFKDAITGRDETSVATRRPGLTAGGQPQGDEHERERDRRKPGASPAGPL